MADSNDDELSLPKATVQKLVTEMLPPDLTFSRESRDLLIDLCVEFVHLLSSEANDVCEKETKKTIAAEHVLKAVEDLGFAPYLDSLQAVMQEHKQAMKSREKKVSKFERSGLTDEELLRQQEALLAGARNRFQAKEMEGQGPGLEQEHGPEQDQEEQASKRAKLEELPWQANPQPAALVSASAPKSTGMKIEDLMN